MTASAAASYASRLSFHCLVGKNGFDPGGEDTCWDRCKQLLKTRVTGTTYASQLLP